MRHRLHYQVSKYEHIRTYVHTYIYTYICVCAWITETLCLIFIIMMIKQSFSTLLIHAQVWKEKLGDKFTTLQQLVSPFGKVYTNFKLVLDYSRTIISQRNCDDRYIFLRILINILVDDCFIYNSVLHIDLLLLILDWYRLRPSCGHQLYQVST